MRIAGAGSSASAMRACLHAAPCVTGDHATITLHEWHQVWVNTENTTLQMVNVAFLD